ncbi:hypothetical protein BJY24_002588 [Nocardia transvalensis]|uniref:Uncharacterized protein n=1 Tax=Nocardia transvalensis TaxID=37333 RepID=A0A7W9PCM9_9NOCA|nr:hypothetical protein [Nocardia transvalensis]MBB5913721.1 hypothetical protein [Nocardia transvalensis]
MTLVVAAHGWAGGGFPDSTALTLLLLIAVVGGTAVGLLPPRAGLRRRAALFAVLASGQLAGHAVLAGTPGHDHGGVSRHSAHVTDVLVGGVHLPTGWMALAHSLAALLCAVLIAAAGRLYDLVSQTVRALRSHPLPELPARAIRRPDTAARTDSFLRLGAIAPRAPPVPA